MKDQELTDILRAFDEKITQSSVVNLQSLKDLQMQKSFSALNKLRWQRIIELSIVATILLFLGNFLYANQKNFSLVISSALLMFFMILDILGNIRQLVLISRFDYAQSVTENQAILASLQTHLITFLRLAILQLPFFMAYILIGFKVLFNEDIWMTGDKNWLIANLILSVAFFPLAVWIYRKIRAENLHINWVRSSIEFSGGKKVSEAMRFLNEIEKFRDV